MRPHFGIRNTDRRCRALTRFSVPVLQGLCQVFAGQAVGVKEVQDDIWLVSFMDYDLGYFDLETRVLEPLENPFGPKVLPM
jgi:hypothetical protein